MQQSTTQTAPQINRPPSGCRVVNHEDEWEKVLPSMEAMHAMFPEQDWSVAGVRRLLDDGDAFMLMEDGDDASFAVLMIDDHPYKPGELELFLLLVYQPNGDPIRRFQAHAETIARSAGARYIRFKTQRPGMLRAAARVGYAPRTIEFVKEL